MKSLVLHASSRRTKSLPVRGAWIEIGLCGGDWDKLKSLPVRGAWIEICHTRLALHHRLVAPRAGSVD